MIAWPEGYVLPFESPWSVLHKLGWFNSTNPAALLQRFFGLTVVPCRPFLTKDWSHGARWTGAAEGEPMLGGRSLIDELSGRTLSRLVPDWDAEGSAALRICPECMDQGYHSLMHQLQCFPNCPIHLVPLVERCPGCDGRCAYALEPSREAYGCNRCRGFVHDEEWLPLADNQLRHREREAAEAIRSWFVVASDIRIRQPRKPLRSASDVDAMEATVEPAVVGTWLLQWSVPSSLPKGAFGSPPVHTRVHAYQSPDGSLFQASATTGEDREFDILMVSETVESIAREFRRRHCRSHPCLDAIGSEAAPLHLETICGISAGFAVWLESARAFAEHLEQTAQAARRYATMYGRLEDIACALRTELSLCLSEAVARVPEKGAGARVRTFRNPLIWELGQPLLLASEARHEGFWLMADVDYSFIATDMDCRIQSSSHKQFSDC